MVLYRHIVHSTQHGLDSTQFTSWFCTVYTPYVYKQYTVHNMVIRNSQHDFYGHKVYNKMVLNTHSKQPIQHGFIQAHSTQHGLDSTQFTSWFCAVYTPFIYKQYTVQNIVLDSTLHSFIRT